MADRQREPWETNAAGAFLQLPRVRGTVEVWAPGDQRFKVVAPDHEQVIVGYAEARERARALARELASQHRQKAGPGSSGSPCARPQAHAISPRTGSQPCTTRARLVTDRAPG